MSDLEDAFAAHLNGKFFWEPTAKPEDCDTVAAKAIRAAQKKMAGKAENIIPGRPREIVENRSEKPSKIVLNEERKVIAPILKAVAQAYNISIDDLLGKSTCRAHAQPKRHLSWAVFRYIPNVSLKGAGRLLDKNYTTVLHGKRSFQANQDFDKVVEVDRLMGRL